MKDLGPYNPKTLKSIANRCEILTDPVNYSLGTKIVPGPATVQSPAIETMHNMHGKLMTILNDKGTKIALAPEQHYNSDLYLGDTSLTTPRVRPAKNLFYNKANFTIDLESFIGFRAWDTKYAGTPAYGDSVTAMSNAYAMHSSEDLSALYYLITSAKHNNLFTEIYISLRNDKPLAYADIKESATSPKEFDAIHAQLEAIVKGGSAMGAAIVLPYVLAGLDRQYADTASILIGRSHYSISTFDAAAMSAVEVKKIAGKESISSSAALSFKSFLLNMVEWLYFIEKLPDKEKAIIYPYLAQNEVPAGVRNLFTKYVGCFATQTYTPAVLDIIRTEDKALRYEKLQKWATDPLLVAEIGTCAMDYNNAVHSDLAVAPNLEVLNNMLPTKMLWHLITYISDATALKIIRFQIVRMLNLCKEFGVSIFTKITMEDIKGAGGLPGTSTTASDESSPDPLEEIEYKGDADENPIDDLDMSRPKKRAPVGGSFDGAIEDMVASFKDDKYSFEVIKPRVRDEQRTAYNKAAAVLRPVATKLLRQIREIKTYNIGGKNPGLTSGRLDRVRMHHYKTSQHIFFKDTYQHKESDLAIGVILDESGSMCGENVRNGKYTCIVLQEALRPLKINYSMIGHTSSGTNHCIIRVYKPFEKTSAMIMNSSNAIIDATSHTGNCDSGALYYMERTLLKEPNKDKICLIFSDGEPTECSSSDLKNQVKHMESKGIKVIGIGISLPAIAEYYSDYANGETLQDMIDIVSGILKTYILEKKE